MEALVAAWSNVTWLVFNWFSAWWRDVDGAMQSIQQIGR